MFLSKNDDFPIKNDDFYANKMMIYNQKKVFARVDSDDNGALNVLVQQ